MLLAAGQAAVHLREPRSGAGSMADNRVGQVLLARVSLFLKGCRRRQLVDQQPVQSQILDHSSELLEVHRLLRWLRRCQTAFGQPPGFGRYPTICMYNYIVNESFICPEGGR